MILRASTLDMWLPRGSYPFRLGVFGLSEVYEII